MILNQELSVISNAFKDDKPSKKWPNNPNDTENYFPVISSTNQMEEGFQTMYDGKSGFGTSMFYYGVDELKIDDSPFSFGPLKS